MAFPTETVYGLGADATDRDAITRVFAAKGRPSNNPLIVHVSGIEEARTLVTEWPRAADDLAAAFWPGPLTLVLPKNSVIPGIATAGGPTIALRCPDHPVALSLIRSFGGPIVGPSANRSGRISPTTADHVRDSLGGGVHVLDGGPCTRGIESTVVGIEGATARMLRLGSLSAAEIAAHTDLQIAGPTEPASAGDSHATEAPLRSPGLLQRHYAPMTPTRLFDAWGRDAVVDRLAAGERLVVISHAIDRDHPAVIRLPSDAEGYARGLYAALHLADRADADAILIESPAGDDPIWSAIRDRLRRASAAEPDTDPEG